MLEPEEQKIITKNEIQYPMDKIEPIDPTLKLQEENQNPKIFNPKIFNPKILNNDYQVIKKRLSIDLHLKNNKYLFHSLNHFYYYHLFYN